MLAPRRGPCPPGLTCLQETEDHTAQEAGAHGGGGAGGGPSGLSVDERGEAPGPLGHSCAAGMHSVHFCNPSGLGLAHHAGAGLIVFLMDRVDPCLLGEVLL